MIYAILALNDYSESYVVCAFSDKDKADNFIEKIKQHETLKPERPESPSDSFTDQESSLWEESWQRWKDMHPAKSEYANSDGFEVVPIELID